AKPHAVCRVPPTPTRARLWPEAALGAGEKSPEPALPEVSGERVVVVEERRDAAVVELIHDRAGAMRGRDHVEPADAFLDPRDFAGRHRQVADAEAEEQRGVTRIARHLAAKAHRLARAQ